MKMISRGLWGAGIGLCVLSVLLPGAGADDAMDWANQLAQAQKERDEWYRQQAQAQAERDEWYRQQEQARREREQADRDQKERDEWYRQQAQAQAERDESYRQQAQAQAEREQADYWRAQQDREWWQAQRDTQQYIWDLIERNKQWHEELHSKGQDAQWGAASGESVAAGSAASAPKAAAVRPTLAPPVWLQAQGISPQRLARLNPHAFRQMVLEHQARVRQQILQSHQPMRHRGPGVLLQEIQNPFVGAAPMAMQERQEIDPRIIQNPFVGSSK